jgi:hypothetical protein
MPLILRILLPLLLLLGAAGCGTRSIVVPVRRPAAIDLHACTRIAVPRVEQAPQPDSLTILLLREIDATLVPTLSDGTEAEFISTDSYSSTLITGHGTISLPAASAIARESGASCVLLCELMETSYGEEILDAEIQNRKKPGSIKHVRQGRAAAVCRILLIDVEQGSIPFVENLSVESRRETHAVDQAPPPLLRAQFAQDLATKIAGDLQRATRPIIDRELVTFLVDSDFPLIEDAIALAEEGRWSEAASLFQVLADEAKVGENADILWYDLGLALQYQQNFSAALAAFRHALTIRERSRYHHAIDALLRAEQQYIDALEQQQ